MRWFRCLAFILAAFGGMPDAFADSLPVEVSTRDVTTATVAHDGKTTNVPRRDTGLTSAPLFAAIQADQPPTVPFDPARMMHVSDIRPGMKGYGLSVFSGLEPERFEAEVIGVRHRMLAGTDIILCRLKSPHLIDLGVVAGMSGSPVYIDDKLIGAVAYGFIDVDDPLAGVTPIEDMLAVYNSTSVEPALGPAAAADGDGFSDFRAYMALKDDPSIENLRKVAMEPAGGGQVLKLHAADFDDSIAEEYALPDSFTLQPLAAPVLMNAHNPLTAKFAATLFPGMEVINAGQQMASMSVGIPSTDALNSPGGPVKDLQAFSDKISGGYAVAVPFVEGDMNMAAIGTVTWREGERLIAFGHPMFQQGTVYFPMAAARINTLIRSRTRPFKLGEPVGHIGMVRQDRMPAIGGLFGQTAKMFPVTATISDPNYLGKREFNFRVFNNRRLTPGLILTALSESLGAAARTGGDSAALYSYSIKLDDGTSVTAENYSSDTGGTMMAVFGAMSDVGILLNNPFKSVAIDELKFQMRVVDRLRQATIEAAVMDKEVYQPGEQATVEWVLRPFRDERVRLTYSFAIPEGLPDGEYEVLVSDAGARQALESKRNPGGDSLNTFDDLLYEIRKNFAENRVYISLIDHDTGVSVNGREMPKLPGSVINLIQDTVDGEYFAPVRGNFVIDADVTTTYEINGKAETKLKVERR